jgi:hypothetical protein
MANRTSRHLDFLVDHLHIVHVVCIFVDFGYCMDPLTCIADDFLLEISPRCRGFTVETVNYINYFFLQIQLNISLQTTHFTIYFPKHRDIIVFISDDRH